MLTILVVSTTPIGHGETDGEEKLAAGLAADGWKLKEEIVYWDEGAKIVEDVEVEVEQRAGRASRFK